MSVITLSVYRHDADAEAYSRETGDYPYRDENIHTWSGPLPSLIEFVRAVQAVNSGVVKRRSISLAKDMNLSVTGKTMNIRGDTYYCCYIKGTGPQKHNQTRLLVAVIRSCPRNIN